LDHGTSISCISIVVNNNTFFGGHVAFLPLDRKRYLLKTNRRHIYIDVARKILQAYMKYCCFGSTLNCSNLTKISYFCSIFHCKIQVWINTVRSLNDLAQIFFLAVKYMYWDITYDFLPFCIQCFWFESSGKI
jgi:hypothetical protein